MRDIEAKLPSVHAKHTDISVEDCQLVLRIVSTVYNIMGNDPKWYACAVQQASAASGVGARMVREIYDHFGSTGEFYETRRLSPSKPEGNNTDARNWLYDGTVDAVTITRRWRDITIKRRMYMQNATSTRIEVEPNRLCEKYVRAALTWAQLNLVPHCPLAECGELGKFDLKKPAGAEELRESMQMSARKYYQLWKEAEDLSLEVPNAFPDTESSGEDDDFEDAE